MILALRLGGHCVLSPSMSPTEQQKKGTAQVACMHTASSWGRHCMHTICGKSMSMTSGWMHAVPS